MIYLEPHFIHECIYGHNRPQYSNSTESVKCFKHVSTYVRVYIVTTFYTNLYLHVVQYITIHTYKVDICMRKTRFCEPLDMDYPQKILPSAGTCTASFSDRLRWPFAATNAKTNNIIHNEWLVGFGSSIASSIHLYNVGSHVLALFLLGKLCF